jgi:1D-myo-inositol-tetrakisphosphate 5-kinase/inositol-polyphosphate multikinase
MADDESAEPSSTELHPFTYQVGGHKGMQVTGEGALIVKAAVPVELQFYQNILAGPALASLRGWVPTYLGNLRLEGQNTVEGITNVEGVPENEKDECSTPLSHSLETSRLTSLSFLQWIVLENVAHGFQKPNILDIKLGTVLYDEEATPEKRERMVNKARCTTSGEAGIRLTGFQVRRTL